MDAENSGGVDVLSLVPAMIHVEGTFCRCTRTLSAQAPTATKCLLGSEVFYKKMWLSVASSRMLERWGWSTRRDASARALASVAPHRTRSQQAIQNHIDVVRVRGLRAQTDAID